MGAEASTQQQPVGANEATGDSSSVGGSGKMGRRSRAMRHRRQQAEAKAQAEAAAKAMQGLPTDHPPPLTPQQERGSRTPNQKKGGSKPGTPSMSGSPSKLRRGLQGFKNSMQRRFSFSSTSTLNDCGNSIKDFDIDSRRNSISRHSSKDLSHTIKASSEHITPVTVDTVSAAVVGIGSTKPEGSPLHHSPSVPVLGTTAARIKNSGTSASNSKFLESTLPRNQPRMGSSSTQNITNMGVESLNSGHSKSGHSVESIKDTYGYHGENEFHGNEYPTTHYRRSNPINTRLSPSPGSYTLPHKRSASAHMPMVNSSARKDFFSDVEGSSLSYADRVRLNKDCSPLKTRPVSPVIVPSATPIVCGKPLTNSRNIDKTPTNIDHKNVLAMDAARVNANQRNTNKGTLSAVTSQTLNSSTVQNNVSTTVSKPSNNTEKDLQKNQGRTNYRKQNPLKLCDVTPVVIDKVIQMKGLVYCRVHCVAVTDKCFNSKACNTVNRPHCYVNFLNNTTNNNVNTTEIEVVSCYHGNLSYVIPLLYNNASVYNIFTRFSFKCINMNVGGVLTLYAHARFNTCVLISPIVKSFPLITIYEGYHYMLPTLSNKPVCVDAIIDGRISETACNYGTATVATSDSAVKSVSSLVSDRGESCDTDNNTNVNKLNVESERLQISIDMSVNTSSLVKENEDKITTPKESGIHPDYMRIDSVESVDLHDYIIQRNAYSQGSVDLDEFLSSAVASDDVFDIERKHSIHNTSCDLHDNDQTKLPTKTDRSAYATNETQPEPNSSNKTIATEMVEPVNSSHNVQHHDNLDNIGVNSRVTTELLIVPSVVTNESESDEDDLYKSCVSLLPEVNDNSAIEPQSNAVQSNSNDYKCIINDQTKNTVINHNESDLFTETLTSRIYAEDKALPHISQSTKSDINDCDLGVPSIDVVIDNSQCDKDCQNEEDQALMGLNLNDLSSQNNFLQVLCCDNTLSDFGGSDIDMIVDINDLGDGDDEYDNLDDLLHGNLVRELSIDPEMSCIVNSDPGIDGVRCTPGFNRNILSKQVAVMDCLINNNMDADDIFVDDSFVTYVNISSQYVIDAFDNVSLCSFVNILCVSQTVDSSVTVEQCLSCESKVAFEEDNSNKNNDENISSGWSTDYESSDNELLNANDDQQNLSKHVDSDREFSDQGVETNSFTFADNCGKESDLKDSQSVKIMECDDLGKEYSSTAETENPVEYNVDNKPTNCENKLKLHKVKRNKKKSKKNRKSKRSKHLSQCSVGTMTISNKMTQWPDNCDQATMVNFDLSKETQQPIQCDQGTNVTETSFYEGSIERVVSRSFNSSSDSVGYYSSSYSEFESSEFEEKDSD